MHIVKHTTNDLSSRSSRISDETGQSNQDAMIHRDESPRATLPTPLPAGAAWTAPAVDFPRRDLPVAKSLQQGTNSRHSFERGEQGGQTRNTDYGYRSPSIEAEAQWNRAQISIMDERFAEFLSNSSRGYLPQTAKNDLNSIDNGVYQFQIALLKSVLMSPVPGIVTGIYKSPGDWVAAGEPVIRVENTETVLLVANLVYRGQVSIKSSVIVETSLFDSPGPRTTVKGRVVAMQGHREDDRWVVIVECNNLDSGGKLIFPPGGTSKNIRLRRDDGRLRSPRCRFNGRRPFIKAI